MTTENANPQSGRRTGRKPWPVNSIVEVMALPTTINDQGFDGRMRRVAVFDHLDRSPESSLSHRLIASAVKYGLISGSRNSDHLELTEDGETVVAGDPKSDLLIFETLYRNSIDQFELFQRLHDRLKDKPKPSAENLEDVIEQLGVLKSDCAQVASVFSENLVYLGLIQELPNGAERVISFDQAKDELEATEPSRVDEAPINQEQGLDPAQDATGLANGAFAESPSVHIDVQIHIDSSAEPDQIDQVFASMAKHLYGIES